jgi:hypothetical protein
MDSFEKLLEEMCPNHAYAVCDYNLMTSSMTIGSLSRGMEVSEAPIEGDAAPYPREDAVMTIFGRHPSLKKHHGLDPST